MELVPLKVTIGTRENGQADHPDFGALPVVRDSGMDWSLYIDRFGGGWHYDKTSGHKEHTPDSPTGQQFGLLFVPSAFADQAIDRFPLICSIIDEPDAEEFYNDRAHAHELPELVDHEAIASIDALAKAGSPISPAIRAKMLDPNDPTPGVRKNHRKTFALFKIHTGITIDDNDPLGIL